MHDILHYVVEGGALPEHCVECRTRPAYIALTELGLRLDEDLRAQSESERVPSGACLFMGKHYGHSKTILFTLNPTPQATDLPRAPIETSLFRAGLHWEGARKARYRNWTGGRHLFKAMVTAAPWFEPELAQATDALIVPWPSRDWVSMLRSPAWPRIRDYSQTLFSQILRDHRPNLVFTSGKYARDLFWAFLGVHRPKPVDVWRSPTTRNWNSEWFHLEDVGVGEISIASLDVFRLPHFSRFSRKQFAAIGAWVAERLPTGAALPLGPQRLGYESSALPG